MEAPGHHRAPHPRHHRRGDVLRGLLRPTPGCRWPTAWAARARAGRWPWARSAPSGSARPGSPSACAPTSTRWSTWPDRSTRRRSTTRRCAPHRRRAHPHRVHEAAQLPGAVEDPSQREELARGAAGQAPVVLPGPDPRRAGRRPARPRRPWPRRARPERSTAARGTASTCSSATRRSAPAPPRCRRTSSPTRRSRCPASSGRSVAELDHGGGRRSGRARPGPRPRAGARPAGRGAGARRRRRGPARSEAASSMRSSRLQSMTMVDDVAGQRLRRPRWPPGGDDSAPESPSSPTTVRSSSSRTRMAGGREDPGGRTARERLAESARIRHPTSGHRCRWSPGPSDPGVPAFLTVNPEAIFEPEGPGSGRGPAGIRAQVVRDRRPTTEARSRPSSAPGWPGEWGRRPPADGGSCPPWWVDGDFGPNTRARSRPSRAGATSASTAWSAMPPDGTAMPSATRERGGELRIG